MWICLFCFFLAETWRNHAFLYRLCKYLSNYVSQLADFCCWIYSWYRHTQSVGSSPTCLQFPSPLLDSQVLFWKYSLVSWLLSFSPSCRWVCSTRDFSRLHERAQLPNTHLSTELWLWGLLFIRNQHSGWIITHRIRCTKFSLDWTLCRNPKSKLMQFFVNFVYRWHTYSILCDIVCCCST